ncbi:DUF1365 domain-containing protein [Burkholderiaceae bacterium DAT-1]|nr:DUF1365 domain-containing protein [Burkholderiaceae bacterium DAT-1]
MDAAFILRGQVMHERLRPVFNRFVYPVFCVRVNLERLDALPAHGLAINRRGMLALFERDYGPRTGTPLAPWFRALLAEHQIECDGEIWLQTFPRVLGFAFNPVSFWYAHGADGSIRAVLAEVNNTFGETHRYLLSTRNGGAIGEDSVLLARKVFHVSPFCEVQGHYRFRFRDTVKHAFVSIDYADDTGPLIRTAIGGTRLPLARHIVWQQLLSMPFLTLGVVWRIHWQALKLWVQRVPFFSKPVPPSVSLTLSNSQERRS